MHGAARACTGYAPPHVFGHLHAARAELATAVAMLREMGMAFWLPEVERELAEASR